MPISGQQRAVIQYRRLEDLTEAFKRSTLEKELRATLASKPTGKTTALKDDFHIRVYPRPADDDNLFLNDYAPAKDYLFGDLVHFTSGHMQALFEKVRTPKPRAAIKQMAPQNGEFIHSQLYWYVRGNHIFVLQARTTRTSDLEEYLSWLLTEASARMKSPLHVILRSKFKPASVGGGLRDIDEINIGGTLAPTERAVADDGAELLPETRTRIIAEEQTLSDIERIAGRNMVVRVLQAMMGDTAVVDDFLKKIAPEATLKLRVRIGMTGHRVKVDKTPLRALEVGLRNLPDTEVSVKGKDGRSTPLGELQLSYPTTIAMKQSLWDPTSVLLAFQRAYTEFKETGKITDD